MLSVSRAVCFYVYRKESPATLWAVLVLDNNEGVDHSSHFFPPLLAAAADYASTKGTITDSPAPMDLHVRLGRL